MWPRLRSIALEKETLADANEGIACASAEKGEARPEAFPLFPLNLSRPLYNLLAAAFPALASSLHGIMRARARHASGRGGAGAPA